MTVTVITNANLTASENKANTFKSRARLTDLELLRMPKNNLE